MSVIVKAWQCIGCGSIEAPQTCIGVCQHRKVEFVYAVDYERELAHAAQVQERLAAFVRRVALTTPRERGADATLAAFRAEARGLLAEVRTDRVEAAASAA